MRLANVDVETASRGRFRADPQAVFAEWAACRAWADGAAVDGVSSFEGIGTLRNRLVAAPAQD